MCIRDRNKRNRVVERENEGEKRVRKEKKAEGGKHNRKQKKKIRDI